MGSVPETTTFSSQSATILVASLSYVVFFDSNRVCIVFVCFPDCQFLFLCVFYSVYFIFATIAMSLLLTHDSHVGLLLLLNNLAVHVDVVDSESFCVLP